jgi:hypothetical protein
VSKAACSQYHHRLIRKPCRYCGNVYVTNLGT